MLGTIIAAVSPAVVVPMMLDLINRKKGTQKGIPTLIMAGASFDDIFNIVLFSITLGLYSGNNEFSLLSSVAQIPLSLIAGVTGGMICGYLLQHIFIRFNPRATKRMLTLLGVTLLFSQLQQHLPFMALPAVMSTGAYLLHKDSEMAHELSAKFAKLWIFSEIILFTLVGAQVDLRQALNISGGAILTIMAGLSARSITVWLCLLSSQLNARERLFCVIAYLPKATVQAAIGGVPLLAMQVAGNNTAPGEIILATAVWSILLTAPIGAWLIRFAAPYCLADD